MWCIVNLPNGTQQAVKWDTKAIGQECLEKVCKALGIICEMEYFGLEHWSPNQQESRTRQWINLRNRLSGDSSGGSGIQLMLALRVKFWVPVHFILQESVRSLFYMQAKVDLLESRLNARDWSNAAKLAALLSQADGIRFNEAALKARCPMKLQKDHEELQKQLLQLQEQQQTQHHGHHGHHCHHGCGSGACSANGQSVAGPHKERKEKEYVLSFKKRRLSKQKSIENIDHHHHHHGVPPHHQAASTSAAAYLDTATAAYTSAASSSGQTLTNIEQRLAELDYQLSTSPLRVYKDYLVRPANHDLPIPDDFLRQIAIEHGKLSTLKMAPKSARYWLLQEIQDLPGYGEEIFGGVTTNESSVRCDIAVGAHGITVCTGDEKNSIPFSAIAAAKSFRRVFKLEYVDDHNARKELEIKLPKQGIAAGLYRSITERHAFYVCERVRGVVTNQFTRDLKGTIASMFKEDTELGKRYVFDIQHTCREVHDHARRVLYERGIELSAHTASSEELVNYLTKSAGNMTMRAVNGSGNGSTLNDVDDQEDLEGAGALAAAAASACGGSRTGSSLAGKLDLAIREKEEREAAIERCVDTRISEAMTCKICMDQAINTMFSPCCHVMACNQCADRCTNCPSCRVKISSVVKIYLPPELRSGSTSSHNGSGAGDGSSCDDGSDNDNNHSASANHGRENERSGVAAVSPSSSAPASASASTAAPKLTAGA